MKSILSLIICLLFVNIAQADDTKYFEAMKKQIYNMDSLNTVEDFVDAANAFERIGNAEQNKWLPFYYASLCNTLASFVDTTTILKDAYLDQALKLLAIADSLQPDESEIYALKGMIAQGRLQIDPMNRYMKYGAEMSSNFQKAQQLNPKNPRPDYLIAATTFYTPEQFGGGPKAAKPMLEAAVKKFNEFIPEDELMPIWGKDHAEMLLKQIPE